VIVAGAAIVVAGERILGIDPGLRATGFGVIECRAGRVAYIASGCVRAPSGTLPDRLKTILEGVSSIIDEYRPSAVAIEKVFVNVNPQSTLLLGQARGAAICAAVSHALPVDEYTALQVKQAVVGQGHAQKRQVQEMVRRLLGLSAAPGTDAADALACAICHAHATSGYAAHFGGGMRQRRGRLTVLPGAS